MAILKVSEREDREFESLESVIERANAGDEIILSRGDYRLTTSLILLKSLSIVGEGADVTRIFGSTGGVVIQYDGEGIFTARGIGFIYEGTEIANVVVIRSGKVNFRSCSFSGAVGIVGERGGFGLLLVNEASGQIISCRATDNLFGIYALARGELVLQGNECLGNAVIGIGLSDCESNIILRRNVCANNATGIAIDGVTSLVEANTCRENEYGILYDSGTGTIRENHCLNNTINGIQINRDTSAILEKNRCQENGEAGIRWNGKSSGTARENTCERNQTNGIDIRDHASPQLIENLCSENGKAGIAYWDNSAGNATGNLCRANSEAGIDLNGSAKPDIIENRSQENGREGIAFYDQSGGTVRKTVCSGNTLDGIALRANSEVFIESNEFCKNNASGIGIYDNSRAVVRFNLCEGNQANGIEVNADSQNELEGNLCQQNTGQGVLVKGNARAYLKHNTCRENQLCGISVTDRAEVSIERSMCEGNVFQGIVVWEDGKVTAIESVFQENGDMGICFVERSAGTIDGCNSIANKTEGLYLNTESMITVKNSQFINNQGNGIHTAGSCRAIVNKNICQANKGSGIIISDGSKPLVSANICQENQLQGISAFDTAEPKIEGNTCERNLVGIVFLNESGGIATSNQCHNNLNDGILVEDRSRPILEENICTGNVGEGIRLVSSKATQKNNYVSSNRAPDPRQWRLIGSRNGGRHDYKQFAAELMRASVSPIEVLERVARIVSPVWTVNSRLENHPNVPNGLCFEAHQSYESGSVSLACLTYPNGDNVALNLTFTDNGSLPWIKDPSEKIIIYLLYGVASGISDWTGQRQPWICTYGNWCVEQQLRMPNGEFIAVSKG